MEHCDKLTLRVEDDEVVFNMFKADKSSLLPQTCLRVKVVDPPVREVFRKDIPKEPHNSSVVHNAPRKKI